MTRFVLFFFSIAHSFFYFLLFLLLFFKFADGTVWSQAVSLSPGEQVNQLMKSWYYMWQACKKKIQSIQKGLLNGKISFQEEATEEEKKKLEEEVRGGLM